MIVDVMDLKFEKLNFSRSYDTVRERRGRSIYQADEVEIVQVNKEDDDNYHVTAKVDGTWHQYYKVEFDIKNLIIQNFKCSCEDFNKGYICKHVIATSMEVLEPSRPSTEEGRKKKEKDKEK